MKKLLLLIMLTSLSCADMFDNWSKESETKFYYFGTLQALDIASTRYAINKGAVETNPLLGKNPNIEKLLLSKAIIIPVMYGLLELQDDKSRQVTLNWVNIMYVGIVGNNLMVGANIKF